MSHASTTVHASRRSPATPAGPTDLPALAHELLEEVAELDAGRTARTLTPGAGSPLKQTLLALRAGARLQEHVAPGPATMLVIEGELALVHGAEREVVGQGMLTTIPRGAHALEATTDAVALLTVVPEERS